MIFFLHQYLNVCYCEFPEEAWQSRPVNMLSGIERLEWSKSENKEWDLILDKFKRAGELAG